MKKGVDDIDAAKRQRILRTAIFYGISLLLSLLIIVISITLFIMVVYLEDKVSRPFFYIFISIVAVNLAVSILSVRGLIKLYPLFQPETKEVRAVVLPKQGMSPASGVNTSAQEINPEYFTDLELQIIDTIKEHGNRMLQSEIARTINVSKASISRALTSLENKGVIVRLRRGVTNEIVLTETYSK
ncbi:MarR family transcriptional regulator [Thermoplasma sp.]|uniref:helix-turn-helix transcriptional regulator n=1 Tax=Thermoplasma sp. TaxID=1973142 RepID=UPI0025DD9AEE|nr:MarR family transcriptional regulator [Thermoplasma sp.]